MFKLLCTLFGHSPEKMFGDASYGDVAGGHTDNIGRQHYILVMKCERCRKLYSAGRFHGPLDSTKPKSNQS